MKMKIISGVVAFVVAWTILVHAQSHWNPSLAYPLYPGMMVHLVVTGGHGGNTHAGESWVCGRIGGKPLSLFGSDIHFASSDRPTPDQKSVELIEECIEIEFLVRGYPVGLALRPRDVTV
jgi:hypothetical protein